MTKATKLYKSLFIRRYIDDILLLLESNSVSIKIIEDLKKTFKEYDLDLTSTIMSVENAVDKMPFLDIEHVFTGAKKKNLYQEFYKSYSCKFYFFEWKIFLPSEYLQRNYYRGRKKNK